ncbi:MAG: SDR family NAD(P)-dependent oxidoreductase [Alicyclobacillus herbarius]|uniref:SDR family NAD(P)-dependent oxidoreductase n=1 Tax=Alicyclobacillus herbarius TaxID=122960 RepID=UPI0003F9DAE2|nr:SDR family NAD(P)-dependent oxidoreductase [Alicyclobacillus herbarius]MCL6632207.1 SDR family NAD(P)-dependent oxidoreductase [Alicyclobacillus herbarius]
MALHGNGRVAVVTGASSGIGAASARALAQAGFRVAVGARRVDRLHTLANELAEVTGERPFVAELDVTSVASAERFARQVQEHFGQVHVLLNNAGLARGKTPVAEAKDDAEWEEMINTNVLGLLRMTRLFLPSLIESGDGHVINLGSIAGRVAYAGGSAYCGSKFAVRAITEALREELLGKPVRVTTIDPGMVKTEFSLVRFHGDTAKADAVYEGMTPLTAEDIADCIVFAATRPAHVNIDAMVITARDQCGPTKVARQG